MSDFSRTEKTARSAEHISRLLQRVAKDVRGFGDRQSLLHLAERYSDYAAALRAVVAGREPEPDPDQPALL